MASALDQVAYPVAASDSQGGLWLACRSYPAQATATPPDQTIVVATSWCALRPATVAQGQRLSPPALAVGRAGSEAEQVYVAWIDGIDHSQALRVVALNQTLEIARVRSPHTTPGAILSSLAACADTDGAVWLAWQETLGRAATIRCSRLDVSGWSTPLSVSDVAAPASEPCLTAAPHGGVWVGWTSRLGDGFTTALRPVSSEGIIGAIRTTSQGEYIDLLPSIAVDGQGRVFVAWQRIARRWGTVAGGRLREETQLYARMYDSSSEHWFNLGGDDGRVLIPAAGRSGSFTGREDNTRWAPPIAPSIFIDAGGELHLLFRRYRDHNPVYDWGFDLYHTVWGDDGWREPIQMSHTAGFPDRQHLAVRMADGGATLVYQFSHLPPTYWHTHAEVADTDIQHSGIACARYPWGSPSPTVRRIGPGRPEYARPGSPSLIAAQARPAVVALPEVRQSAAPPPRIHSLRGDETFFLGDLHTHSYLSTDMVNKDGSPDEHYRWARDLAGWDFYALTDHVEEMSVGALTESLTINELYHQPGVFVPLYALEWTNWMPADGSGHSQDLCVYFADRAAAWQFHYLARQTPDARGLLPMLDQAGLRGRFFVVRHFHGMSGPGSKLDEPTNQLMATLDPSVEPLIEIVQHRGSSVPIQTALLTQGIRRGVVGGTDHGRPPRRYAHVTTGVWATDLSRAALFTAFFKRRTWVTNGTHLACDFMLNETVMGGEAHTAGPVTLTGFVESASPLQQVTIYRNADIWQTLAADGHRLDFRLEGELLEGEQAYWVHALAAPQLGLPYPAELWSSPSWASKT